jgi:quinol monooxygenase YgiN
MSATEKMVIVAKLTAKGGRRDDLVAAFGEMFTQVESEGGTEVYVLHEDLADADVLWVYELYTDGDAATAHGQSEVMGRAMTEWGDLLGAAPEINMATPVQAKGLAI